MNAATGALGPGCGPAAALLPEMVDVVFGVKGENLPRDHEWPLFREIARIVPWIAKTPRAGILPMRGPRTSEGGVMITQRSRIVIRLPRDRVCSASAIERESLHVGEATLVVGEGSFRKHQPAATLYSPRVSTGEADEIRFLEALEKELARAGRARPPHLRPARGGRARGRSASRPFRWPCTTFARPTRSCCSGRAWDAASRSVAASSFPTRPSSRPTRAARREDAMTAPAPGEPAAMVDLTGLTCPGPILGAREILEGLRNGQVLLLLSDCPGTRDDLFAWARQTGNEVVHTEPRDRGATAYFLRKGRSGKVAAHARLDLRGVSCPGPILEARQLLKGMRTGEVLMLVSDCPGVRDDISGWAEATNIELAGTVSTGGGAFEFYLRKL